jgi:hypothetical protein
MKSTKSLKPFGPFASAEDDADAADTAENTVVIRTSEEIVVNNFIARCLVCVLSAQSWTCDNMSSTLQHIYSSHIRCGVRRIS